MLLRLLLLKGSRLRTSPLISLGLLLLILLERSSVVVLPRALLFRVVGAACSQVVLHGVAQCLNRRWVAYQMLVRTVTPRVTSQIVIFDSFQEALQDFIATRCLRFLWETLATQPFQCILELQVGFFRRLVPRPELLLDVGPIGVALQFCFVYDVIPCFGLKELFYGPYSINWTIVFMCWFQIAFHFWQPSVIHAIFFTLVLIGLVLSIFAR